MDDSPPKYLNSPETAIYKKGDHLYGLSQAREAIRRQGAALLVEGYFDVIGAHSAGFDHAVATLGTALTPRQVGQLRRMTPEVVFVYDGDAAGLRAMRGSAGLLLETGATVNVAVLPEGEDPDSLLRKEGPDAFDQAVKSSVRLTDFVLESLIKERRGAPAWIVERMFPIWDQIANPIERGRRDPSGRRTSRHPRGVDHRGVARFARQIGRRPRRPRFLRRADRGPMARQGRGASGGDRRRPFASSRCSFKFS